MRDLTHYILPDPADVREARTRAGDTVEAASERLHISPRTWFRYEAGNTGMPAAYWELYLLKTGQLSRPR